MKRIRQQCEGIPGWLETCSVRVHGVEVQSTTWGSGIVATETLFEGNDPVIAVPSKLILSQQYVWTHAETDTHLKECLEALGDFTKTARGSIMIFLLLQITATSPDVVGKVGVENAWTTYVQYLPDEENIPTFWSEHERLYAQGTSLALAIETKLKSLRREFNLLKESLQDIPWCAKLWFDSETGCLSFRDWLVIDAIYRSRAMEIPSHGLCMVPIADMANHGHGNMINARTDVDESSGDVRLVLDQYPLVEKGQELRITYGEEKSACEMLFSYGFMDQGMTRAESIFLDLQEPGDDPIFVAKKHAFECAPGVRISYKAKSTDTKWIGAYVWLLCINEEDGLGFEVVKQDGNGKRLKATWKGQELKNVVDLEDAIQADEMHDLFRLRAYVAVNERIKAELTLRGDIMSKKFGQAWWDQRNEESVAFKSTARLQQLEWDMLKHAEDNCNHMIGWLYGCKAVKRYFNGPEDSENMWAWYKPDENNVDRVED